MDAGAPQSRNGAVAHPVTAPDIGQRLTAFAAPDRLCNLECAQFRLSTTTILGSLGASSPLHLDDRGHFRNQVNLHQLPVALSRLRTIAHNEPHKYKFLMQDRNADRSMKPLGAHGRTIQMGQERLSEGVRIAVGVPRIATDLLQRASRQLCPITEVAASTMHRRNWCRLTSRAANGTCRSPVNYRKR
jgi:hypothetical protein